MYDEDEDWNEFLGAEGVGGKKGWQNMKRNLLERTVRGNGNFKVVNI